MLISVFRRLAGNRWKALSMLVGLILAVAIAFAIPIYADALMQRILTKTFESAQTESGEYPAYVSLDYRMAGVKKDAFGIISAAETVTENLYEKYIPIAQKVSGKMYKYELFQRPVPGKRDAEYITMNYLENFTDYVDVVLGRMYNPDRDDGVIEVVVRDKFLVNSLLTMNQVYEVDSMYNGEEGIKIEIVGVVAPKDASDLFWFKSFDKITGDMFSANTYFEKRIAAEPDFARHFTQATWYTALDYTDILTTNVEQVLSGYESARADAEAKLGLDMLELPAVEYLDGYLDRMQSVLVTMYVLAIPIFLLLAYYIIMTARLKLDSERAEISVMQSRGASRGYILRMYLLESVLMMGAAVIIGPFVGILLCKIIGASNGFLEFVNRTALKLKLRPLAFEAAAAVAVLFIVITMIPAFMSAGVNIVETKRAKARRRRPFYHRYFLDVIFLAAAAYAYYVMELQRRAFDPLSAAETSVSNTNFLLYISNTLLALGAGMLFLRIYPYIVRLIFSLGRRIWPAWAYSALNSVGRSTANQSIMLFLILTMSIGIFSADAARSINSHIENNARANVGADVSYMPKWKMYDSNGSEVHGTTEGSTLVVKVYDEGELIQSIPITYFELLTSSFGDIKEISSIARVYREDGMNIRANGKMQKNINLMAIDPYEFGLTAFSTSNMNVYHLNEYLNAMSAEPSGVIVSNSILEKTGLKAGDQITYLSDVATLTGTIIAGVDSWPGFEKYYYGSTGQKYETDYVITSLSNLFDGNSVHPYGFWINKADNVSDRELYDALADSTFGMTEFESTAAKITEEKNDPALQGTNGMLSVSFITAIIICGLGFMIYWIISIRGRTLQFGIARALGMSKAGVMLLLLSEQLLVSGVAVAAGVFIGKLGSTMFVPQLSVIYSTADEIVPFRVTQTAGDLNRTLLIMVAMLVFCCAVLFGMVIRQKIDRAVKLGED